MIRPAFVFLEVSQPGEPKLYPKRSLTCPELTHPVQQLSGQGKSVFYADFLFQAKNVLDLD